MEVLRDVARANTKWQVHSFPQHTQIYPYQGHRLSTPHPGPQSRQATKEQMAVQLQDLTTDVIDANGFVRKMISWTEFLVKSHIQPTFFSRIF